MKAVLVIEMELPEVMDLPVFGTIIEAVQGAGLDGEIIVGYHAAIGADANHVLGSCPFWKKS